MSEPRATETTDQMCRPEEVTHNYDLSVRKQMKAVLTHQFALEWPWPYSPQASTKGDSSSSTGGGAGGGGSDAPVPEVGPSAPAGTRWSATRRYNRPTYILSLTSDPFLHNLTTRRVAVCATTGSRVLLPLIAQNPPTVLPCGNTAYWRLGDSQEWSCRSGASHMAEIIVGEVGVIEHISQSLRTSTTRTTVFNTFMVPRVHLSGERRVPVWNGRWVREEAVQSFLFHSLPFKVLWLSQRAGHLLVSLPCEERVVTLYAAPRPKPASEPVPLTVCGSFALPRGAVPLDVTDIEDRPFVAIGTYEHGVLLCRLDPVTCAVSHIVRTVAVRTSQAVFPVVHVASLFPPLSSGPTQSKVTKKTASASPPPPPPWAAEAAWLHSLSDGALLCSSPYDTSFVLVKLSDGRSGVPDDFPASRSAESFQFVTRNSEGVWATTAAGAALLFHTDIARAKMNKSEMRVALISPVVRASTVFSRNAHAVLCLTDGPLVYQSTTAKYVRDRCSFWMAGVDATSTLTLFSCRTALAPFEKLQLKPIPAAAAAPPPPPPSSSGSAETGEPQAKRRKEEVQVADYATGVSFIFTDAGVVQVAVAHHKNVISTVTWDASRTASSQQEEKT